MPKWRDLRRYLEHNAKFLRHGGEHDFVYLSRQDTKSISEQWRN